MSIHRVAAAFASTATLVMLASAPVQAQIPFEPDDSYPSTRTQQPATNSDKACLRLTNTAPNAPTIPPTGGYEPRGQCSLVPSLPQRRLTHADLIQALRDGH